MAFTETYASVAGAGAHDGTSAANAWDLNEACTITTGAQQGDRVNVIAGTYIVDAGGSAVLDIGTAGIDSAMIEWRAYTTSIDDFTIGDAHPVVLQAGTNTLASALSTSLTGQIWNRFIGFRFTGGSSHGADLGQTDNYAFEGCLFDNNGGRGLAADNAINFLACEFQGNTTNAFDVDNNCYMQACEIHNEASDGTAMCHTASCHAINNLMYDGPNDTYLFAGSNPSAFIGNTCDGEGGSLTRGLEFNQSTFVMGGCTNNLLFDCSIGIAFVGNVECFVRGYNQFSNCTTDYLSALPLKNTDITNSVDPFTNSGTRDYTLADGSAAIDAGIDAGIF